MLDVLFGGFACVMRGVGMMTMSNMSVMGGLLMVAGIVMAGRVVMVLGGVLVMFGGFTMMIRGCFGHGNVLLFVVKTLRTVPQ